MREHQRWMEQALREAEKALEKREVPVGAVVVYQDRVIGRGHNQVESLQDPTAHAEILAITAAADYLSSWRLEGTSLYVTLEPCPMCAGAIILARIANLIYGASDPRRGACGSVMRIIGGGNFDHQIKVASGVLETECAQILRAFFKGLRI